MIQMDSDQRYVSNFFQSLKMFLSENNIFCAYDSDQGHVSNFAAGNK